MVYGVKEAVRVSAVRVLKKISNPSAMPPQDDHRGVTVKSQSCQFVFVVSSRITRLTPLVGRDENHKLSFSSTTEIRAHRFNPMPLRSRILLYSLVIETHLFNWENSELVAEETSNIIHTRFQFTAATLSGEIPIKVVVYVERKRDVTDVMPEDINLVFASTSQSTRYDSEEDEFMDDEEEETRYLSEQDEILVDDIEPEEEEYSECCAFERMEDDEIRQKFEAEDRCAICLDGLFENDKNKKKKKVSKTRCGHVFHESCLVGWLPKCATCPMCRSSCIAIV